MYFVDDGYVFSFLTLKLPAAKNVSLEGLFFVFIYFFFSTSSKGQLLVIVPGIVPRLLQPFKWQNNSIFQSDGSVLSFLNKRNTYWCLNI